MSVTKNRLVRKFSTIPNAIIIDKRVSNLAVRVYLYLISKPDGWQVYNADVMEKLEVKTNQTIADAWRCLIDAGWITRTQQAKTYGKFSGGFDYTLNEYPHAENTPDCGKTVIRKNRNTEKPEYGKNHTLNKTEINNIIKEEHIYCNEENPTTEESPYLEKMRDKVFQNWQNLAKEHEVGFTIKEWDAIYGYIITKPGLNPHQIRSTIIQLKGWADVGLDVYNAILGASRTGHLKQPLMDIVYNDKGGRIYGQDIVKHRNKILEDEAKQ